MFVSFLGEFVAHSSPVTGLAFGHYTGRLLVTGCEDGKVHLWEVSNSHCMMVCILYILYFARFCLALVELICFVKFARLNAYCPNFVIFYLCISTFSKLNFNVVRFHVRI